MSRWKKLLAILVLLVGAATGFASCSCSTRHGSKPSGGTDPVPPSPETPTVVTYSVTTSVVGGVGGQIVSEYSTNVFNAGASPLYTVVANTGFVIKSITINDSVFFTSAASGLETTIKDVPIISINKNYVIVAEFFQLDFFVNLNILDSEFAVADGGTVVSSTGSNQHKGGTSPVYTITPNDGYCIYWVKVDGVTLFDYLDNPNISEFVVDSVLQTITSDHNIEVAFYKLFDPTQTLATKYYKSSNMFMPETIMDTGENSVSVAVLNTNPLIPSGRPDAVTITEGQWFNLSQIAVSLDGGLSKTEFSASADFAAPGFSYNSLTRTIQFDNLSEDVRVETYCETKTIKLTIYDYDAGEVVQIIDSKHIFSYFDGVGERKDYYWYYSLSAEFREENVYRATAVGETNWAGNDIYHIYLTDNMIAQATGESGIDQFILIYSSTEIE